MKFTLNCGCTAITTSSSIDDIDITISWFVCSCLDAQLPPMDSRRCSLTVSGPVTWNSLPQSLHDLSVISGQYHHQLKFFLLHRAHRWFGCQFPPVPATVTRFCVFLGRKRYCCSERNWIVTLLLQWRSGIGWTHWTGRHDTRSEQSQLWTYEQWRCRPHAARGCPAPRVPAYLS